ncbi:MAG: DUF4194 domain-containing protein [Eubacteriales bacterium]|nr:DUF4194 domain-containing protein [Eubacteriales bacterium]
MINEMWLEIYDKMPSSDRGQIIRCINQLLARTYLLSESYDDSAGMMKSNSDYRLVDRYFNWLHDYLELSGWNLVKDRALGVIYVESTYNYNRQPLNSVTTLILLTLKLLYDEEREKLTLQNAVNITTSQVVDRLIHFNAFKRKPSDKDLTDALRLLSRYNIVQRLSGEWAAADCQFLIMPSVSLLLSGDAIGRIYRSLEDESSADNPDKTDNSDNADNPDKTDNSDNDDNDDDEMEIDDLFVDADE